jgi:predicted RNA-binding protein with PUA-like domain
VSTYLFKTEPGSYSYDDLVRDKRAVWDGVSNPVALRHLRSVSKGDTVLIYHTGDEKAVVGIAVATSDSYPDPKLGDARRAVVDIAPKRRLERPVTLATVKADAVLKHTDLARQPRLSVMPLSEEQVERILEHASQRPR